MGECTMQARMGDYVRIVTSPEVDADLWDEEGIVAAITPENRLIVELGDGVDCTVNPDQVELVLPDDPGFTFGGTTLRGGS